MTESYSEKAKQFLERQLKEYEMKIKKLKRKRKLVKLLFTSLIVVSVTSSTVCAMLVGFSLPPLIIPILSTTAGLTTALSVKFNLEGKSSELNKTIAKLSDIKCKIHYVVSCNGDFAENEYREIMSNLI